MSAYFILTQTVTGPQKYSQEYIPGVLPFLAKYKAEVVVAEMEATSVQGNPAKGVVVSALSFRAGNPQFPWRSRLPAR